jgi:hypothetical protein
MGADLPEARRRAAPGADRAARALTMPRSLGEWIGRSDDTPVPPRVRLRAFERFARGCDPVLGCGRPPSRPALGPVTRSSPSSTVDQTGGAISIRSANGVSLRRPRLTCKRNRGAFASGSGTRGSSLRRAARSPERSPAAGSTAWMGDGSEEHQFIRSSSAASSRPRGKLKFGMALGVFHVARLKSAVDRPTRRV